MQNVAEVVDLDGADGQLAGQEQERADAQQQQRLVALERWHALLEETLGTSRTTRSLVVNTVNMYKPVPTTAKMMVKVVNSGWRLSPPFIKGAMKMPRKDPTATAPMVRALASLARSPDTWVMAPARDP